MSDKRLHQVSASTSTIESADIIYVEKGVDNSDAKMTGTSVNAQIKEVITTEGYVNDRGSYDASVNVFPSTGGSGTGGAILKGNLWTISVAGILGTKTVNVGDEIRALSDSPGQTSANWAILQVSIGYVPENTANKSTDVTLGGASPSDILFSSQKAGKSYIDSGINSLRNYINSYIDLFVPIVGLIMSNNTSDLTNDIDFTLGAAIDSSNLYNIPVSALTKRLDATFVTGTNQGMLDTGSKANSTYYYIYAIGKSTDLTAGDILASTNASTPSLPSGWDLKKLIRQVYVDSVGITHITQNYNTNADYSLKYFQNCLSNNLSISANDQHWFGFRCNTDIIIQHISFFINTAVNGSKIVYGIYNDNGSGAPGTVLVQTQEFTIDATNQGINLILSLRSQSSILGGNNRLFWVSLHCSDAINIQCGVNWSGKALYKNHTYSSTMTSQTGFTTTTYCAFSLI